MADKPVYTWQKQKLYPNSGEMFDSQGNVVDVADFIIRDSSTKIWPFGETLVGYKMDDITLQFQYPFINTDFDFRPPEIVGDGVVGQSESLLQLSSTTGSSRVTSRGVTSYVPGHSGYIDFTASFTGEGQAIVGGDNAFQIRYNNGVLSFGYVKAGSFISTPVNTEGLDLTSINIWRIVYGYLGVASPTLFVKQGAYKEVAKLETEGLLQTTHVDDPNFPAVFETSGEATLKCGSYAAGVIGTERTAGFRVFSFPSTPIVDGTGIDEGDVTLTGSDVATLAIFRSKTTFQTKDNSVTAFISGWENYVGPPDTGGGEVIFQLIANPTFTAAPTFTDIDTQNSTVEVDHTEGVGASVSYTGGGRVLLQKQIPYLAGQGNNPGIGTFSTTEAEQLGATLLAGDTLCIIAKDKAANGVIARTSLSWKERF